MSSSRPPVSGAPARAAIRRAVLIAALSICAAFLGHAGTASAETTLDAELSTTQAKQGDVLTVSGTVAGPDGPIDGAAVELYGGSEQSSLASFVTDSAGAFTGELTIPEGAGAGSDFPNYPIIVSVPPTETLAAGEQLFTIALTDPPPPAEEPTPESEPTPQEQTPSPAPVPTENPPLDLTLVPWWMIVVGLAGFGALAGLAFLARRKRPDENARLFR